MRLLEDVLRSEVNGSLFAELAGFYDVGAGESEMGGA